MYTPESELPEEYIEVMTAAAIDAEEEEERQKDYLENRCHLHGRCHLHYEEENNRDSKMICHMCESPESYSKINRVEARIYGWYDNRGWHDYTEFYDDPCSRHSRRSIQGKAERIRYKIDTMILHISDRKSTRLNSSH